MKNMLTDLARWGFILKTFMEFHDAALSEASQAAQPSIDLGSFLPPGRKFDLEEAEEGI